MDWRRCLITQKVNEYASRKKSLKSGTYHSPDPWAVLTVPNNNLRKEMAPSRVIALQITCCFVCNIPLVHIILNQTCLSFFSWTKQIQAIVLPQIRALLSFTAPLRIVPLWYSFPIILLPVLAH